MEQLHKDGETDEAASQYEHVVASDPSLELGSHDRKVLDSFQQHEIDYRSAGNTTEQSDFPLQLAFIFEGEQQASEKLHDCSEYEGNSYRKEYAEDNRQCLFGVEQVAHVECIVGGSHLEQRDHESGAQKLEHKRDRGRGRHAQRIEDIEQDDVGHHHRHEDCYNIVEREVFRPEDAMSRHIHHAVAHRGADEDADCRHDNYPFERCCPRSDCGRKEIDSVVAHAHRKVEHRQQK